MVKPLKFSLLLAAVCLLASNSGEVFAQSDTRSTYTQSQLNRVTSSSNASKYSSAQFRNKITSRAVPQFSYSTANRGLARSLRQSRPTKPFSGVKRGPSVTPYLGFSRPFGGVSDIYSVRRQASLQRQQQQQQRVNERQQVQNIALQHQLNQMAARGPFSAKGSETITPTGHAATFMNESGFRLNYGGYYSQ